VKEELIPINADTGTVAWIQDDEEAHNVNVGRAK
jgi:hypothetical protein